jgi:hypothetical protein
VGVELRFFVALGERRGRDRTRDSRGQAKKEGLAITLVRALIASPHYHEE